MPSFISVSYTHLDVYKRQALLSAPSELEPHPVNAAVIIVAAVAKKENEETNEKTQVPNPEAVSYTHLIVQKKLMICTVLFD